MGTHRFAPLVLVLLATASIAGAHAGPTLLVQMLPGGLSHLMQVGGQRSGSACAAITRRMQDCPVPRGGCHPQPRRPPDAARCLNFPPARSTFAPLDVVAFLLYVSNDHAHSLPCRVWPSPAPWWSGGGGRTSFWRTTTIQPLNAGACWTLGSAQWCTPRTRQLREAGEPHLRVSDAPKRGGRGQEAGKSVAQRSWDRPPSPPPRLPSLSCQAPLRLIMPHNNLLQPHPALPLVRGLAVHQAPHGTLRGAVPLPAAARAHAGRAARAACRHVAAGQLLRLLLHDGRCCCCWWTAGLSAERAVLARERLKRSAAMEACSAGLVSNAAAAAAAAAMQRFWACPP